MLYKYFPVDRIDVLQNMKIRFSPLSSLNDPFESVPLFDFSDQELEMRESMKNEFMSEVTVEDAGVDVTEEFLDKTLAKIASDNIEQIKPSKMGRDLISFLGDRFCALCLSRTNKSLLMWSHYADEGKGFVLGFDPYHSFFHHETEEGEYTAPFKITYSSVRSKTRESDIDYFEKLFCHKPIEWCYEEEVRLFRDYHPETPTMGTDEYGQFVRLSELPSDLITAIYIGYNSGKDLRKKIYSAVKTHSLDCAIFQGALSDTEYKVVFDEKNT